MTMISIAMFLLLVLTVAGYLLAEQIIHIRTFGDEDIYKYETKAGTLVREDIESLPKEEVFIHSPYGYRLRGLFFKAPQDAENAIILVHGVSTSLVSSLKYMWMFRKRGFHVLAYDHCRHGGSGGSTTTFGFNEKHDLNACVDWLLERVGQYSKIGIFGESMGAATALQHAAIDSRAAFYIADCPFSDLAAELIFRLRKYWWLPPSPLLHLTRFFAWLRSGFRIHSVSPIRDMAGIETPILFIHGKEDKNIPMEMTLALYQAKQGPKQLYLVPGADHAQSLRTNPHIYDRIVGEFLEELGLATTETKISNLEETKSEEFANNGPSDKSGFGDDAHYDDLVLA